MRASLQANAAVRTSGLLNFRLPGQLFVPNHPDCRLRARSGAKATTNTEVMPDNFGYVSARFFSLHAVALQAPIFAQ